MKTGEAIAFISDSKSPAREVLRVADELFSRNSRQVYVCSGQQSSDEMVQGILHALIKVVLKNECLNDPTDANH